MYTVSDTQKQMFLLILCESKLLTKDLKLGAISTQKPQIERMGVLEAFFEYLRFSISVK